MSSAAFPTSPHPPAVYADDLAVVVVRRLEKSSSHKSWGLLKTMLLGVPSFGLLPLVLWPARFREYVVDESQAMQELAQWAKLRGRQPAAVGPLLSAAEETTCRPLSFMLSAILAALVVGVFAIQFNQWDAATGEPVPFTWGRLLAWTYLRGVWHPGLPEAKFIYRVWVIALSVGFAVQWLAMRAHSMAVRQFVHRFNPIAEAEGLPPVRFPISGSSSGVFWLIAGLVLARYGAWWGLPMVLAGMTQKRYTHISGKLVSKELANRVKDIVTRRQLHNPIMPNAMMPVLAHRCGNPRCMAMLRPLARFCSRCGSTIMEVPR